MPGSFDMLNDALFTQMAKLQRIDPRDKQTMETVIEQSKAVSQLAGNIVSNANTAISLLKLKSSENQELSDAIDTVPKMLGGGK